MRLLLFGWRPSCARGWRACGVIARCPFVSSTQKKYTRDAQHAPARAGCTFHGLYVLLMPDAVSARLPLRSSLWPILSFPFYHRTSHTVNMRTALVRYDACASPLSPAGVPGNTPWNSSSDRRCRWCVL